MKRFSLRKWLASLRFWDSLFAAAEGGWTAVLQSTRLLGRRARRQDDKPRFKQMRPYFEPLETRYAMSVTHAQVGGALTISSNGDSDAIVVSGSGGNYEYQANGGATQYFSSVTSIVVQGNGGNDTLDASGVTDLGVYLYGGAGSDILIGGDAADYLDGGADGDTYLVAAAHAMEFDVIADSGTAGTDTLDNGSGEDFFLNDFYSYNGIDVIDTGGYAIYGNSLANWLDFSRVTAVGGGLTVYGGDGNDTIISTGGNDRLYGQGGNDVIANVHPHSGGSGVYDGGSGTNTISLAFTSSEWEVLGSTVRTAVLNYLSSPSGNSLTGEGLGFEIEGFSNGSMATPIVGFSPSTYSHAESGSVIITVVLDGPSSATVTVGYNSSGGSASSSDFTAQSGTLTFSPGDTSKTISVPIATDSDPESNEYFYVWLFSPTNAELGVATATVTIIDDDSGGGGGGGGGATPTLSFSSPTYTVSEGGGTATIYATLSTATSDTVTAYYSTSNGSATAGSDYSAASGALTFAPGSTTASFSVSITDDSDVEYSETVNLSLSSVTNATLGTGSATLTILDNDSGGGGGSGATPTLSFSSPTYTVSEGGGTATIYATLSTATSDTVTAYYSTSNGSATAGSDYSAASGTLTFAPGSTTASFSVSITDDSDVEYSETVNLSLSSVTNATLGTGSATLTILDNDSAPLGSITGIVWNDANADGLRSGESGLSGVNVWLYAGTSETSGTALATATTASDGSYSFASLAPGSYTVKVQQKSGYGFSAQDVGSGSNESIDSDVAVSSGETSATVSSGSATAIDAGEYQYGSITGIVWNDANADGLRSGESGLSGVNVWLYAGTSGTSGTALATATTASDGSYSFASLAPGSYTVKVQQKSDYGFSAQDVGSGSNESIDSDAAVSSGETSATVSSGSATAIDAGEYQYGSITGIVWNDANADGLRSGESGLSGVNVWLYAGTSGTSGTALATATTASDGSYSFASLAPGNYTVKVQQKSGYGFSAQDVGSNSNDTIDSDVSASGSNLGETTSAVTVSSGSATAIDAGEYVASVTTSISGLVWKDSDGDGIQDVGETGLSGVSVWIYSGTSGASGTLVTSTTTDSAGHYSFAGLSSGAYSLLVEKPSGYHFTTKDFGTNDTVDSDVDSAGLKTFTYSTGSSQVFDAGEWQYGTVSGIVWNDSDGDGIRGGSESRLSGLSVWLYSGSSTSTLVTSTSTSSDGSYSFANLAPGVYTVKVEKKSAYSFTLQDKGSDESVDSDVDVAGKKTATVASAATATIDAGEVSDAQPGRISGLVWKDRNGDGIRDTDEGTGETGISGVSVWLYSGTSGASGTLVTSTLTDANGQYAFSGMSSGDYTLQVETPAGYHITTKDAGTNDAVDSDVDSAGLKSFTYSSSNASKFDAGEWKYASVSGLVWNDTNADGMRAEELGLSGVSVWLYAGSNATGSALMTTTAGSDGSYVFSSLAPGEYVVKVDESTGFHFTKQDEGSDDAIDSDVDENGLYDFEIASDETAKVDAGQVADDNPSITQISGLVWYDLNKDGIRQSGGEIPESGASGIVVKLEHSVGSSWELTAHAKSNASGAYYFDRMATGTYRVRFEAPVDYEWTEQHASESTATNDSDPSFYGYSILTIGVGEHVDHHDAGLIGARVASGYDGSDAKRTELGTYGGTQLDLMSGNVHVEVKAAQDYTVLERDRLYYYGGLVYNSETVDPHPMIDLWVPLNNEVPNSISASLVWNNGTAEVRSFSIASAVVAGNRLYVSMPLSAVTTTGIYRWKATVTLGYSDGSDSISYVREVSGQRVVVSNASPSLSPGWSLPDVNHLEVYSGSLGTTTLSDKDVLLVQGDGGYLRFTNNGTTFDGPNLSDHLTKSLNTVTNVATYTYKNDASEFTWEYVGTASSTKLKLARVIDNNNLVVTYAYDSNERISEIANPNGNLDLFTYDAGTGRLSTIGRKVFDASTYAVFTTGVGFDSAGNISQVTDPNGNVRYFTYDTDHRLLTDYVASGLQYAIYNYDSVTHIPDQVVANGVRTLFGAQIVAGLAEAVPDGRVRSTLVRMTPGPEVVVSPLTGGVAWIDADGDGIQDAGESGLAGVTVQLWSISSAASAVATAVTDATGNYSFDGLSSLSSGTYFVKFLKPANYRFTQSNKGSDSTDSDVDLLGRSPNFEFNSASSTAIDIDAGFFQEVVSSYRFDAWGRVERSERPDGSAEVWIRGLGGRVASYANTAGIATQYDYVTGTDDISTIRYPGAATTTLVSESYHYDSNHRQIKSTDVFGKTTTIVRDSHGNVTSVINPNGTSKSWSWSSDGLLLSQTDENLKTFSFGYDSKRRLTSQTDPLSHTTTYAQSIGYGSLGGGSGGAMGGAGTTPRILLTTTDPDGVATSDLVDGIGQTIQSADGAGQVSSVGFNPIGLANSRTDNLGRTFGTQTDSYGRANGYTDPMGQGNASIVYDSMGRVAASVDAYGNRTTNVYDLYDRQVATIDPYNNITTTVYDNKGRVSATIDPWGNRTTLVYDQYDGRQIATIDSYGNRTTTVYDNAGRVVAQIDPWGNRSTTVYDEYTGRQIAQIDPYGNRTTTVYDDAGQVVASIDTDSHATTYVYDDVGQRIATIDRFGQRTTSVYSPGGQLVATIDSFGNRVTNLYDSAGRRTGTIDQYNQRTTDVYDSLGQYVSSVDAYGNAETYVYDSLGRQIATVDRYGNRTTTVYDAFSRVDYTIDRYSHVTDNVYDSHGRLEATVDIYGNRTTIVYDDHGRQVAQIDPFGNRTTTVFDSQGRTVGQIDPYGNRTTVIFDDQGRQSASVDSFGNRSTTVYDDQGRQVAQIDPFGNRSTVVFDTRGRAVAQVDPFGNRSTTVYDDYGRAEATIDRYGHRSTVVYDDRGRQVAQIDVYGNRSTTVYDSMGRQSAQIDVYGNRSTVVYDSRGRQEAQVDPYGNRTTTVYDTTGRVEASIDMYGHRSTTVFDSTGRAEAQIDVYGNRTTAVYDDYGRRVAQIDAFGNRTSAVFDGMGRQVAQIDRYGNRTTAVFDSMGRESAQIDMYGNRTTTVYDAQGRASAQIDMYGKASTVVFDILGREQAQIDRYGNRTTTVYDSQGRVAATIDMYGHASTTVYDTSGREEASIDVYGNRSTVVYDDFGRVSAQVDRYGNRTTTVYDSMGREQATIDPYGNRSTVVYDSMGRQSSEVDMYGNRTTTTFDTQGRVEGTIDPYGNRATTVYDDYGRTQVRIDAFGNRTTTVYDSQGRVQASIDRYGHPTTYVYDSTGRHAATIDVYGQRTTNLYDSQGRQYGTKDPRYADTFVTYDDLGRVESQVNAAGNVTTMVYDDFGRQVAQIDALGHRSTAVFDDQGRQSASIDALGNRTTSIFDGYGRQVATVNAMNYRTTEVYDASGQQVAHIDALGHRSTVVYDDQGRQVAQIDSLGNRTTTVYDDQGRYSATIDPLGHRVTTVYDAQGRQSASIDALGNRTTTVYDDQGRYSATINSLGNRATTVYDTSGRQAASIDSLSNRVTAIYDAFGGIIGQDDGHGTPTTTMYDVYGRTIGSIDGLGNRTTQVLDVLDRVVATIDPLGNRTTVIYDGLGQQTQQIDALSGTVTQVYDAVGNRIAYVDPLNNRTTFGYDALGRKTSETDAFNHTTTFAFDAADRQISRTDKLGRRIDTSYDDADRKTGETWVATDGSTVVNRATWTYDDAGRVATAADQNGTYTFTYDAQGRVSHVDEPKSFSMTFVYDAQGHRTGVIDSLGGIQTSVYDDAGQLTSREQGSALISMSYYADGQLAQVGRYVDSTLVSTTEYVYDANGRIDSIQHKNGAGANVDWFDYGYDEAGRLISLTEAGGSGATVSATRTFDYDDAGQLTGDSTDFASGTDFATTFTYDANGNRTNTGYTTGTNNQLTSDGTWNYTYDAENNLIEKDKIGAAEKWLYGYDHKNRLIQAQHLTDGLVVDLETDFKYDVFGNRVEKSVDADGAGSGAADATWFAQDGFNSSKPTPIGLENFDVLADLDSMGALKARYIHGDGVDEVFARQASDGTPYFFLTDHQGSVRDVVNDAGTVVDHVDYNAFGKVIAETNATYRGRYGYTGREQDVEIGLQYNRARYYDAETGRWVTQDPLGFDAGDSNLYRYVANAFVQQVDPNGLEGKESGPPAQMFDRQFFDDERSGKGSKNRGPLLVLPEEKFKGPYVNPYLTKELVGPPRPTIAQLLKIDERVSINLQRISYKQIKEMKNDGLIQDVKGSDGNRYSFMSDVVGDSISWLVLAPYKDFQITSAWGMPSATVSMPSRPSTKGAMHVGITQNLDLLPDSEVHYKVIFKADGLPTGDDGKGTVQAFRANADRFVNNYYLPKKQNEHIAFMQAVAKGVWEFATGLIPGVNTFKSFAKGDIWNGVISLIGDAATIFSFGATRIANSSYQALKTTAKVVTVTSDVINFGVGTFRLGQGISNLASSGGEDGWAQLGEALLRLYGPSKAAVQRLRNRSQLNAIGAATSAVNCFPPNTLVHTDSGLRRIDSIESGDVVWSYSFKENKWVKCTVECRHDATYEGPMMTIRTTRGEFQATAFHPVWVVAGEDLESRPVPKDFSPDEDAGEHLPGRWIDSHHVKAGDVVSLRGGERAEVVEVAAADAVVPVCNLTVIEIHNFAVGHEGFLVHNTSASQRALDLQNRAKELNEAIERLGPNNPQTRAALDELQAIQRELSSLPKTLAAVGSGDRSLAGQAEVKTPQARNQTVRDPHNNKPSLQSELHRRDVALNQPPRRVTNPKHHPNSKSPEPANVDELFGMSIVDSAGVRWAKDANGTIHRFSRPSNGETHWNGSTAGPKPIKMEDIPVEIRRAL
jgi:RHS repeat-associated protein